MRIKRESVKNIQYNIKKTEENIKRANDMKNIISDQRMKRTLDDKNKRREAALDSMSDELEDEIEYKNNQYM